MLSAAAVVGREFDLSLVGPACELPTERVLDALSEAVALGVAEEPGTVEGYRFSHSLAFQRRYEQTAVPFDWQFTRSDLDRLLRRLEEHDHPTRAA
ncbi:MAG TPA: hypothetical protein VIJ05_00230 [Actinomycetes bacterium]